MEDADNIKYLSNIEKREPKSRQVKIRLTEKQASELKRRAKNFFKSPTGWATALVISNLSNHPIFSDTELEELRKVRQEIHRIGINLNQISRSINMDPKNTSQLYGLDWPAIIASVNRARDTVDKIRLAAIKRWSA